MLSLHKRLPKDHDKLQLYRSITALKQSKDFRLLADFLDQVHTQIDKENRNAQAPSLQWNQGASQFLQELRELISDSEVNARSLSEKLQS